MSARYGTGGNNVPLVTQGDDTFCITGNAIDRQPMNGVLQIKVKHQNEKSPAKFARPKKGATNQTGEKALTGRGKIWLLKITFAR